MEEGKLVNILKNLLVKCWLLLQGCTYFSMYDFLIILSEEEKLPILSSKQVLIEKKILSEYYK